jgi:hypothetical protein
MSLGGGGPPAAANVVDVVTSVTDGNDVVTDNSCSVALALIERDNLITACSQVNAAAPGGGVPAF